MQWIQIVFINGEYWGVHHLSERVDKYYLNEYYQVHKDSIDLLSNNSVIEEGNSSDFLDLINYIETHSLIEKYNYEYVAELMDIPNFIDEAMQNHTSNNLTDLESVFNTIDETKNYIKERFKL